VWDNTSRTTYCVHFSTNFFTRATLCRLLLEYIDQITTSLHHQLGGYPKAATSKVPSYDNLKMTPVVFIVRSRNNNYVIYLNDYFCLLWLVLRMQDNTLRTTYLCMPLHGNYPPRLHFIAQPHQMFAPVAQPDFGQSQSPRKWHKLTSVALKPAEVAQIVIAPQINIAPCLRKQALKSTSVAYQDCSSSKNCTMGPISSLMYSRSLLQCRPLVISGLRVLAIT
jgi:hypothetical protein